jgi:hypothetical protein
MKASTRTGPCPIMIPSPSPVAPAGMRLGTVRSVMDASGKISAGASSGKLSGWHAVPHHAVRSATSRSLRPPWDPQDSVPLWLLVTVASARGDREQ